MTFTDIMRPHFPRRSYYGINWRNGKPKMPEAYPNRSRIPDEVAPLGFILAFGLSGESEFTRQAELEYLMTTQHSTRCARKNQPWEDGCCIPTDIAPEWQELREKGIIANTLNALRDEEIDRAEAEGAPTTDIYGLNLDATPPYDLPTRGELALMEWEKSSWLASPWVKVYWDLTDDNKVTLKLHVIKHQAGPFITHKFTADEKRALLMELIDEAAREGRIPTPDEVREMQFNRERYARLGSPKSIPPAIDWNGADLQDPYRFELHATDPDTHNRRPDRRIDSPWLLGYADDDDEFMNEHATLIKGLDGSEILLHEGPELTNP